MLAGVEASGLPDRATESIRAHAAALYLCHPHDPSNTLMSLFQMLLMRRGNVLEICRTKMADVMGLPVSSYELEAGLTVLYDELVEVLRVSFDDDTSDMRRDFVTSAVSLSSSKEHAQDSRRHGYTISQLVRGYGCICQGITEYAHESGESITAAEFAQLNLCLDVAIAQAVSEFQTLALKGAEREDTLRLGFLVHELRNYLTSAFLSHELIRRGAVGSSGATSAVLTNALQQMRELIDRAVAEIRMDNEPRARPTRLPLINLISQVESSALPEADEKYILLRVDVDADLEVYADAHLMASAISNMVQNAIKFTKVGGTVWIRAYAEGSEAVIEIEDRCGGLPEGKLDVLFSPFVQEGADRSGLGLGLSIAKRAAELNGGALSVRNVPEVGCVFSMRLPARSSRVLPGP